MGKFDLQYGAYREIERAYSNDIICLKIKIFYFIIKITLSWVTKMFSASTDTQNNHSQRG